MPSSTVDRRLASFCTSRLRAVRMQAKSDRNYPVLPYLRQFCGRQFELKEKKMEKSAVWTISGYDFSGVF